jgi:hypothetical protein
MVDIVGTELLFFRIALTSVAVAYVTSWTLAMLRSAAVRSQTATVAALVFWWVELACSIAGRFHPIHLIWLVPLTAAITKLSHDTANVVLDIAGRPRSDGAYAIFAKSLLPVALLVMALIKGSRFAQ